MLVAQRCTVEKSNDDQLCHGDNWGRHSGTAPRFRLTEHQIV